ncbi:response regulator [Marispirochaeta aestuarii]|uniref:response regulator n=1 Tax=Marispirochaeta aestuarii TaxID=1963862 RepID=UPI0029C7FCB1|nr:response regulator [Marispirochaeta aestuarii]
MTPSICQAVFDNVSVGLALLSRDLRVLEANRVFLSMLGRSGIDNDLFLTEIVVPEDKELLNESFKAFLQDSGVNRSIDLRYDRSGFGLGWCSIQWALIPHPDRKGSFPMAVISEVSKEKEAALRLQLESAEARKAAQIKSDFLANMSHEIRTPIHTITGMSELLLDTSLDEEQQEYASQVQYSADVLQGLINDILDFSKIEAGHLKLESIDFNLHDLVEDSVKLVSMEAHKKGLEVAVFFEQNVPYLLTGDPVRLRQIIVNLFNNAVKFTHRGEIIVSVSLMEENAQEATLLFQVKDTGIGIPEDKRDRLFKVFSQVDSSTTRKYGGTGLGLSISRNLVSMMGGEIGVESEEGQGSIFRFTCILAKQEEESLYRNLTGEFFEGIRALVCDDSMSSREILCSYLKGWGCLVEEVGSGEEGLALLRQRQVEKRPFSIALVDQIMPGMDGWQLASEINSDKQINTTKLVLMSPAGKSGEEAKMKLLKWFDGYLNKPIKKNQLFELLFRIVNQEVELESIESLELAEELESALTMEKGKILVAEDHEVNQILFRTILENDGYTVSVASNGKEAVAFAEQDSFDLIFMDVQMPEMNGYEATREIRKAGIETPIIAVTASAIKGEQEKCFEAGMDDFLTKPFKKNDLMPVLDKWAMGSIVARKDRSPGTREEQKERIEIDQEVFSFDEAVSTFMGQTEVVIKVLEGFLPKVERQISQIKSDLKTENFEQISADAHSIKGSSWNLMAKRLGNRAFELEKAAKESKSDACALNVMGLEDAFAEFREAAEQILVRYSE